jgi:hypothetical protein
MYVDSNNVKIPFLYLDIWHWLSFNCMKIRSKY